MVPSQSSLLQYLDQLEANFMARINQLEASLGLSPDRFMVSKSQLVDTLSRVARASAALQGMRAKVLGPGKRLGTNKEKKMSDVPNPLDSVNANIDKLTADLGAASSDINQKFSDLATEIAALKAGTPVTQAQIDAINAKLEAADSSVSGIDQVVKAFNA